MLFELRQSVFAAVNWLCFAPSSTVIQPGERSQFSSFGRIPSYAPAESFPRHFAGTIERETSAFAYIGARAPAKAEKNRQKTTKPLLVSDKIAQIQEEVRRNRGAFRHISTFFALIYSIDALLRSHGMGAEGSCFREAMLRQMGCRQEKKFFARKPLPGKSL